MTGKTAVFLDYKGLLFTLAYNMLGDIHASETIVREVYLQWLVREKDPDLQLKSYFVKATVNNCIDYQDGIRRSRLNPLRNRLTWSSTALVPEEGYFRAELYLSLSTGIMRLLEQLDLRDRALFILREVFAYDYRELASIFDKGEEDCRHAYQLVLEQLGGDAGRFEADVRAHENVLHRLMSAILERNKVQLFECLRADVLLLTDRVPDPIRGREDVSRFMFDTLDRLLTNMPNFHWEIAITNGLPTIISYYGAKPVCLNSFESDGVHIHNMYIQTNPETLKHLQKQMK